MGLYAVTGDCVTMRPRMRNTDVIDLSKLNIQLAKPDMWAYQSIRSFQGGSTYFHNMGFVVGLIAVGSTSDSVVHLVLECKHNGKLGYYPHTSVNMNVEVNYI